MIVKKLLLILLLSWSEVISMSEEQLIDFSKLALIEKSCEKNNKASENEFIKNPELPSKTLKIWHIEEDLFNHILNYIEPTPDQGFVIFPLIKKRLLEYPRATNIKQDNIRIFYKLAHCQMIYDSLKTWQTPKKLEQALTEFSEFHNDFGMQILLTRHNFQKKEQVLEIYENPNSYFNLAVWVIFLDEAEITLSKIKYENWDFLDSQLGFERRTTHPPRTKMLHKYLKKNRAIIMDVKDARRRTTLLKGYNRIKNSFTGLERNTSNMILCCLPISCCWSYEQYKKCINSLCDCTEPARSKLDSLSDAALECICENGVTKGCNTCLCENSITTCCMQTNDKCIDCLCENPVSTCARKANLKCIEFFCENKVTETITSIAEYIFCTNPVSMCFFECLTCSWSRW